MSAEERLMKAVIEATGDDTITDVAEFEPKGSAAARGVGAAAGTLAGGGATDGNSWGKALGAGAGAIAGEAVVGAHHNLPPKIAIGVSPEEVYLLGMTVGLHMKVDPIAKIHRSDLGVEVHQRLTVRTIVLEDMATGAKFPLEVGRLNMFHAKSMVELLMLSDHHHDEEAVE